MKQQKEKKKKVKKVEHKNINVINNFSPCHQILVPLSVVWCDRTFVTAIARVGTPIKLASPSMNLVCEILSAQVRCECVSVRVSVSVCVSVSA